MVESDLEFARRHAFQYAIAYVVTEDAEAYAEHYVLVVKGEEDMRYWPAHSRVFNDWRDTGNE